MGQKLSNEATESFDIYEVACHPGSHHESVLKAVKDRMAADKCPYVVQVVGVNSIQESSMCGSWIRVLITTEKMGDCLGKLDYLAPKDLVLLVECILGATKHLKITKISLNSVYKTVKGTQFKVIDPKLPSQQIGSDTQHLNFSSLMRSIRKICPSVPVCLTTEGTNYESLTNWVRQQKSDENIDVRSKTRVKINVLSNSIGKGRPKSQGSYYRDDKNWKQVSTAPSTSRQRSIFFASRANNAFSNLPAGFKVEQEIVEKTNSMGIDFVDKVLPIEQEKHVQSHLKDQSFLLVKGDMNRYVNGTQLSHQNKPISIQRVNVSLDRLELDRLAIERLNSSVEQLTRRGATKLSKNKQTGGSHRFRTGETYLDDSWAFTPCGDLTNISTNSFGASDLKKNKINSESTLPSQQHLADTRRSHQNGSQFNGSQFNTSINNKFDVNVFQNTYIVPNINSNVTHHTYVSNNNVNLLQFPKQGYANMQIQDASMTFMDGMCLPRKNNIKAAMNTNRMIGKQNQRDHNDGKGTINKSNINSYDSVNCHYVNTNHINRINKHQIVASNNNISSKTNNLTNQQNSLTNQLNNFINQSNNFTNESINHQNETVLMVHSQHSELQMNETANDDVNFLGDLLKSHELVR